jgi:hypothetical protein
LFLTFSPSREQGIEQGNICALNGNVKLKLAPETLHVALLLCALSGRPRSHAGSSKAAIQK